MSLRSAFLAYNDAFFSGNLPADITVKWARLDRDVAGDFNGSDTIRINSRLRHFRPVWRLTLLHEMAHLETWDEKEAHGPRWQREMRRLYRLGAFKDLL